MGKFRELSIDEATNIAGGTFEDMAEIMASINNGTYRGGSIIHFSSCTGMITGTCDLVYGSPSAIYVDHQLVYTGTPR